MKKMLVNFMAIIGLVTVLAGIIVATDNIYAKVNAKSEVRKSNEYVYTQLDNLINEESVDRSITIERCDNGDYRIVHNNGFKDYKYDTIYKNSNRIVEVRK